MKPIETVPNHVEQQIRKECDDQCSCCGDAPVYMFYVHHSGPRDPKLAENLIGLCIACGGGGVDLGVLRLEAVSGRDPDGWGAHRAALGEGDQDDP